MTIAQAKQFYKQDKKKYEVEKNKEFLVWLEIITSNGFTPYMNIEELQELIDVITYWYEFKYPDRFFEVHEGITDLRFQNNGIVSKMMNIEELLYRLSKKQNDLIDCEYRSTCGGLQNVYNEKGEIVGYKNMGLIHITRLHQENKTTKDDIFIHFDTVSGLSEISSTLMKDITSEPIQIESALGILRDQFGDSIDLSSLEMCIYIHECDMELRRRILQMTALKLLYSNRTIPEHGYKRAKYFIQEFNDKLGLVLSTDEIDDIMNNFYKAFEQDSSTSKTSSHKIKLKELFRKK